ncbi:MAG: DegT/DnrJ/EryC1/StrS family aminotransferase [Tannerella sp.]|jgi:dTDP-4-amino-4,6-dideoxygalactose transaminase|nr:DegT/DnrJ/EryC1/StrS family aminotransferase [Tannerella sp.]
MNIQMVDLHGQYQRLENEIDAAIKEVINSTSFINGPQVNTFCSRLAAYLNIPHVIPCGNGTDAIRLALQALQVKPGNEIILPAFMYIAAAEMVAAMSLIPVLVDVDPETFNINTDLLEKAITRQTKAIIVVHLFGQTCNMEAVMKIAEKYKLSIIEDNAQSLGADYTFSDGSTKKAGTIGLIGTTSFFPTKPLGCYGDGGALMTSNSELAGRIRLLANHGQSKKYHHQVVGCNSRLDTIQAAILNVKLNYMDEFTRARQKVAQYYDQILRPLSKIQIPIKSAFSTHIYHQYTLCVKNDLRNSLQAYLKEKGIPSTVYYPLAVHEQEGYKWVARLSGSVSISSRLCKEVLSLPVHSGMTDEMIRFVTENIVQFFRNNQE